MKTYYQAEINTLKLIVVALAILFGLGSLLPSASVFAGNNYWSPMGLYGIHIYSLAIVPSNAQVVYAGSSGGQVSVYKSIDGGGTWFASSSGIREYTRVYGFVFDPKNSDVVYAATDAGLYKSVDAGETWILKSVLETDSVTGTLTPWGIAISPVGGVLYLATPCFFPFGCDGLPAGIYRSVDAGETWELLLETPQGTGPTLVALAPSAPHIIYAGSQLGGSIYKSMDGGETWQKIDSNFGAPPPIISLSVDKHDAQVVYLGLSGIGLFKTTNGGQSWVPTGTDLGSINVNDIKISPHNQQVIYVAGGLIGTSAATTYGVYRSLDNDGLSWAAMNSGMGERAVYSLVIDNNSPPNIYAGTTGGVWKYTLTSDTLNYSLSINNGALFTNQTAVTLNLTVPPGTTHMMISNDGGFSGANWEPFSNTKDWTITSYENYVIPRIVYAKFMTSGKVSGLYQDDIVLDIAPPSGTVTIVDDGLNSLTQNPKPSVTDIKSTSTFVSLQFEATDDVSGVAEMIISNTSNFADAKWEPYRTSKTWSTVASKDTVTVYVKFKDNAGNHSLIVCDTTDSMSCAGTFSDVFPDYWASAFIERLANAKITSGFPDGTYRPTASVTRGQMAVFLLKAMYYPGSYNPPDVESTFSDTDGHWAGDWIEALKASGITGGFPDGTFRPENPVTRAQMAIFLLKALNGPGYEPPAAAATFSDTDGHWASNWIEALRASGLTGGYPDGTFRPDQAVTRAEMAVFIVNAFGLP